MASLGAGDDRWLHCAQEATPGVLVPGRTNRSASPSDFAGSAAMTAARRVGPRRLSADACSIDVGCGRWVVAGGALGGAGWPVVVVGVRSVGAACDRRVVGRRVRWAWAVAAAGCREIGRASCR